ncbi:MAG TPA: metallophosphoesterase [Candidatus Acidoferrales bacterium]|nr:metallophosphoesterase [Candidatus Acidoferrales bacterium]
MTRRTLAIIAVLFSASLGAASAAAAPAGGNAAAPKGSEKGVWKFAASGDSRNCGDVVMPAIAASVRRSGARFYWHLGDFRRIAGVDEDIQHQPDHLAKPLTMPEYEDLAWKDFLKSQIKPFGRLPVYLARGNHELVPPKTTAEYLARFSRRLNMRPLRLQRLRDDPADRKPKPYYHWVAGGVDFITLDNGVGDQFDADQLAWFEKTLRSDSADTRIHAIVAGMHEALPESISKDHSMSQSEGGTASGLRAYEDLLRIQNENHKRVYVLGSHSHYFMDGIFNTAYWHDHGGVLPGWIVGTAGAVRYALPADANSANAAETNIYGFLTGAVHSDGEIQFDFQRLNESDVPVAVKKRYTPEFVHWCFAENSQAH